MSILKIVMFCLKSEGKWFSQESTDKQTDGQMDGHYQVHYLWPDRMEINLDSE